MRLTSILLLTALLLPAQELWRVPDSLIRFLELTPAQVSWMASLQEHLATFTEEKNARASAVNREIRAETARPDPDVTALGLRYRELEAIRREIGAERLKTGESSRALLTDAQKVRLKLLDDALKNYRTACDAASAGLVNEPPVEGFAAFLLPAPVLIGGPGFGTTGCNASAVRLPNVIPFVVP